MGGNRNSGTSSQTDRSQLGDTESVLTDDEFYRALASLRRRRLLAYLIEQEESTVDELAGMLATREATANDDIATQNAHQRMETSLVHVHLPMLAAAGLVEYDSSEGSVVSRSLDERIRTLIQDSLPGAEH
jgi:DNA-binding GntR family transcriptional regulator